jgi:hypothetical protein
MAFSWDVDLTQFARFVTDSAVLQQDEIARSLVDLLEKTAHLVQLLSWLPQIQ